MLLHLGQRFAATSGELLLVGEQIVEPNTSMPPDFLELQVTSFQPFDERRPRNVEEVGGLLGGQQSLTRHDGHTFTGRESTRDREQGICESPSACMMVLVLPERMISPSLSRENH